MIIGVVSLSLCNICSGTDITNAEEMAIKLECVKTKHPQLHIESKIYKMMQGGGKPLSCPAYVVVSLIIVFHLLLLLILILLLLLTPVTPCMFRHLCI